MKLFPLSACAQKNSDGDRQKPAQNRRIHYFLWNISLTKYRPKQAWLFSSSPSHRISAGHDPHTNPDFTTLNVRQLLAVGGFSVAYITTSKVLMWFWTNTVQQQRWELLFLLRFNFLYKVVTASLGVQLHEPGQHKQDSPNMGCRHTNMSKRLQWTQSKVAVFPLKWT